MIPPKHVEMSDRIAAYVEAQAEPPSTVQERLVKETLALGGIAEMQIPHAQGVLLTLLTRLVGAATVLEIGTFTGYSTICLASGLPPGGTVTTLDISRDYEEIATRAWRDAGLADRIRPVYGPAADAVRALPEEPHIDLAFVDADKTGYEEYWELLLPRIRPGGLILADNVLYAGEAADPAAVGNAAAIRAFNERVRADDRVESLLVPIADGMTVARKREGTA
ncbi:O-methyltransferase [Streptomyces flaveolus]|uniref:O-methyltransferase n=1 Tax=Streptomyces flaveolus TaxID=67297 RepID=UPI0034260F7B